MKGQIEINLKWIALLVLGVIVLMTLADGIVIIGPGERGVLKRWGAVQLAIYNEGLGFKFPISDSVDIIDVKTLKVETSATAASKDLQDVTAKIALNYKVLPSAVASLRQNIGLDYREKVIDPAIQESVKAATAKYTAEELITQRAAVRELMKVNLQDKLQTLTAGSILVEEFNIIDFQFSEGFNAAINAKVTAEQQALQQKNLLEKTKYEAQQAIAQAEGAKQAKILNAQGEAESIRIQSEALRQNKDILQLRWIEKWDGKLPQFMADGGGTGVLLNMPANISAH